MNFEAAYYDINVLPVVLVLAAVVIVFVGLMKQSENEPQNLGLAKTQSPPRLTFAFLLRIVSAHQEGRCFLSPNGSARFWTT